MKKKISKATLLVLTVLMMSSMYAYANELAINKEFVDSNASPIDLVPASSSGEVLDETEIVGTSTPAPLTEEALENAIEDYKSTEIFSQITCVTEIQHDNTQR
jgi:ABC-type phosphate transport system substrate-binding protein